MPELPFTRLRQLSSGSVISVRSGEEITCPGFYIIVSGHVLVRYRFEDQICTVLQLEQGESFVISSADTMASYQVVVPSSGFAVSLERHDITENNGALIETILEPLHLRLHRFSMLCSGLRQLAEDIPAKLVQEISDASEYLVLDPYEVLLCEGDPADSVFLLLQGRLRVFVGEGDSASEVGNVERGEIFGEMAILSDEPRSASISAMRHSEIARFSKANFSRLIREYPSLSKLLNGLLIQRIKSQNQRVRNRQKSPNRLLLAVLPEAAAFLEEVVDDLVPEGRVVREQDGHVHFDMRGGVLNPARLNELFDRIEQDERKCYYPCSCGRREWLDLVLPRADEIWLFLDPEGDPEGARHAIASFVNTPAWETSKKVLVFLHQTLKHTKGTKHWLDALKPDQHFHIRVSEATDKARLRRYLLDQSLGLVLGGGGARGFAHIGIVKAFDSAGLKFDWFGGTSIGAVMAAWLGQGLAPDEIVPAIRKFFVDINPLGDYTLPLVSLSRSARLDRLLKEGMGLGDIEDMPLPFFCISSDLSVAEERVHQRGTLWRAVRASIAIPGIIAPVIQDNHFLVDGALLNNLPVDHMASFNSGPVIAIDVSDHEPLFTDEVYVPSFGEYVWRKVRGKTPKIPTILETLSRSTTLASSSRANKNKYAADFYLKPDLTQFASLEFKSAEVIIEAGYQAGMRALDKELAGIKNLRNGKGFP